MPRRLSFVALCLLTPLARPAAAPPPDQWIAVVAPAYRDAVEPLVRHRRAQGHVVRVVPPCPPDDVRRLADAHPGRSSVLLVGAVQSAHPDRAVAAAVGTVSRMIGQPTDAPYGGPAVAVGRFPARDADEVRTMVRKVIDLETAPPGAWKRRLTVLAGIPAFNPVVDRLVESVAFARFDRLNPVWSGQAVYTSRSSRFCPPDRLVRAKAVELLARGQALTLYLGHSDASGLYAGEAAFLSREDFASVRAPGVFITFGCLGCQLAGKDGEGYGVAAVRNPHGPAAVIGSHGICFAAMCQLASDGLFESAFAGRMPTRLGDAWLAARDGIAAGRIDFLTYRMLDAVDGDPKIPQATQRREHLEMFVLLGDPATRLPVVLDDIALTVPDAVAAGTTVRIAGTLPERLSGRPVEVTVERTPASVPTGLFDGSTEAGRLANFDRANRFELARTTLLTRGREFATEIDLPAEMPWPRVTVRVRSASSAVEAVAAARVEVRGR